MAFETPITIKEVIENIHRKNIYYQQFRESMFGIQIEVIKKGYSIERN
ncbi:hypothetical protein HF078_05550 [Bacillus sp. RO2]|nr:hypothetical protein [Bacillus sp. RO2]NMH72533.1 hypothetical protein [Bacillus sp. RO2]